MCIDIIMDPQDIVESSFIHNHQPFHIVPVILSKAQDSIRNKIHGSIQRIYWANDEERRIGKGRNELFKTELLGKLIRYVNCKTGQLHFGSVAKLANRQAVKSENCKTGQMQLHCCLWNGSRTSHPHASRPPLLIQAILVPANFVQGHNCPRQFHLGS